MAFHGILYLCPLSMYLLPQTFPQFGAMTSLSIICGVAPHSGMQPDRDITQASRASVDRLARITAYPGYVHVRYQALLPHS